ncbi:zinc-binding dehydrogenase [Novosphingobium sp.]|uniref:zinc-dependent alcohol dehydrogenase n=1 Tax=Novosphingobium sp. TaxID=1874826 RepID=UPI00286DCE58|nr:zinc-binding dehydrogenase [Novosphingobium sp.]
MTSLDARPQSYRASIFRGPGKVDVVDLPYPACGDDEVIVRNVMTGVCGSDIFAWQKHGPTSRIWIDEEFGHESVSEVVELGRNVQGLKIGDRVFVNTDKAFRDKRRVSAAGGFSSYLRIPQCEVGYSLLPLGNDLPLRSSVLFEPFVIATRGVKQLAPQPGDHAVVFGAGIIGMASAIMLKWYGCEKVMVVDLSDFRLENAAGLGFATCNPARENLRDKAKNIFGGSPGYPAEKCGARLYVDAVGVASVIDDFAALAPRDGSLTLVGVHKQPVALDLAQVAFNNWHIHGCGSHSTEEMWPEILDMMRSGRFDLASLITHEYPLEQIEDALEQAGRADEAQKVCITLPA